MSLGLGQLLGGAILGSGLFGGNDEDEEKQGIMGGLTNISNSMFAGMSREQVYRLGQGFNTMRLEPDQAMHESFENRISDIRATDAATANKNATVTALLGMTSDKYPNGRTDLAAMVKQGVLPPAEAISMAIKVEPLSDFEIKMQWLKDNPNASAEQKALAGITIPVETEFDKKFALFTDDSETSILTEAQREIGLGQLLGTAVTRADFEKKIDLYNELKGKNELTPDMLELLGIPRENQADFEKKMNELELLAEESGMKPLELMNRKIDLVSSYTTDDGRTDTMITMAWRAKEAGLIPGEDDYKAFMLNYGGGDTKIDIDIDQADDTSAYMEAAQKAMVESDNKELEAVRKAEANIRKLDQVLKIIDEGDPNLGALSGFYQTVDEVMAKFGLSEESAQSATDTQLLEALLGSDVFGMIAILGIGARGIDTPAERDFLIKVMTGERKMTPEALRRMTLYRRKYSRMVIEDYNNRLKDGYYKLYIQHARPLKHIDVTPLPEWQPPAVVDTLDAQRASELGDKYNLN